MLGEHDLRALDELYARVVWIPDGELERLDEAAREYREIVGEPDPPPSAGGTGESGRPAKAGERRDPARSSGATARDGGRRRGSLADAIEQAIASARAGQLEQLDEDVDLEQVLARCRGARRAGAASSAAGAGPGCRPAGCPTAASTARRYPDEVQHARRYANRLRQAITRGTRQIDKRTPGGRFDGRAYARGRAEQAAGRPVTTHPWRVTRQVGLRSRSRTSG